MKQRSDVLGRASDIAPEHADAGEIAGYVEASRAALDRTLSELERRMTPQGVIDAAVDRLRHGGGAQYLHGLRDAVVRNPLPVVFTAVGLAWTMFAERHPTAAAPRSDGDGLQSGLKKSSEALSEGAQQVRARAHDWMEQGRSGMHSARSRAQAWGSAAAEGSRASVARVETFSREHPLIVAGAGLTVGAIVAALLPPTRMEDERLGQAREAVLEEAGDTMDRIFDWQQRPAPAQGEPAEAVAYHASETPEGGRPGEVDVPKGSDQGPGTEGDVGARPPTEGPR